MIQCKMMIIKQVITSLLPKKYIKGDRKMKKFLVVLVMGILLFVGCDAESSEPTLMEDDQEAQTEESAVDENKEQEESIEEETEQVFNVGDSVELDGTIITVVNVEKSPGNEWDKPQEGNEFVIITVRYENNSDENISYNPFDFQIKNSQGQITEQAFVITEGWLTLNSGELAPGGKVEGTITFEAPIGDEGLQLIYTPNWLFDDKKIVFNLQ